jgi:hypothetical protein
MEFETSRYYPELYKVARPCMRRAALGRWEGERDQAKFAEFDFHVSR